MKVYELIDLLNGKDPNSDIVIVNDNTGQRLGDAVDVDEDGDTLIYVDVIEDTDF